MLKRKRHDRHTPGHLHSIALEYADDLQPAPASNPKGYTQGPIDNVTGQRAAFPLQDSPTPDNADVVAYLASVRHEQHSLPSFVTCKPELGLGPRSPRTMPVSARSLADVNSSGQVRISSHWYQRECARFETFRARVQDPHSPASSGTSSDTSSDTASRPPLRWPSTMAKWRLFIHGKTATPGSTHPPELHFPVPSVVHQLPYDTALKLLKYSCKWTSSKTGVPSPMLAVWIYALLARLADTLTGDEVGLLRQLARRCTGPADAEHESSDDVASVGDTGGVPGTLETDTLETDTLETDTLETDTLETDTLETDTPDETLLHEFLHAHDVPAPADIPLLVVALVGVKYRQCDLVQLVD